MASYRNNEKQRAEAKKVTFIVHNQYNSPLGLYSAEEVAKTLQRHTSLLANGAVGVDFNLLSAPNLCKSEVYKMLNEDESQLHRNFQHKQVMVATTEMKRVAWPPNIVTNVETIETHEFGNDSGRIGTSMHQPSPLHDAYFSQKLQQEINTGMFPQQAQQQQQEFYQQEETPPKIPPRVLPKPILRQTSGFEAQNSLPPLAGSEFGQPGQFEQNPSTTQPSKASQEIREPREPSRERIVRMSSRGMPEPFSSNELVGDRPLIAKPAPPPGLILGRASKKTAPFLKDGPVIRSEPFFRRGTTPVRMLGDMVWPPKGAAGTTDGKPVPPLSPGTVRRQQKNYREFFMQNQLPQNFPTYRAPPGTQHFGLEEGENATPM